MDENAPIFTLDNPFYKSQLDKNLLYNVYKNGEWGAYWHSTLDNSFEVETSYAFCMLEERANLSSFKWVQGPNDFSIYDNFDKRSLAHVYYSSLNFKDVMLAVGRISPNDSHAYNRFTKCYLGTEFSGRTGSGKRIMGMARETGIATMVEYHPQFTWSVPDNMTLEEAASIPIIYSTVIYAFFFKMQFKKGCSILIHSGSGGVGQAAINICLHYGCNIFTTVGTPEKIEFIKKTFPQIPESHIGNSRDTSFLKMITEQTNGEGVDVVLNSLAEDKLRASVHCVAKGGHFLEIGKYDMVKNNYLELGHFLNDISFCSVQLDMLFLCQNDEKIPAIRDKLQEMLDQNIVKPINRTVFQINEVESAFKYMASGKHIGKLVIKIRDEEQDLEIKPNLMRLKAKSRVYLHKNKSYVILGGLGGFGMELADWLITRGARNIVLSSRTGIKNGYQSYRIKLWRSYGINVVISTSNISQESGVKEILEMANSLGPVAGIFNLALLLKDGLFSKQTEEDFRIVVNPKAIAAGHLDKLSRKMCPHLEYFVMFSSLACGHGNGDQTNYGFANSIMERICESRRANNLPGIAIQWGPIGEVGYFSDLIENDPSVALRGFAQQKITSCLEAMDLFMALPNPILSSSVITEKHKIDSNIISTVANLLGIKDFKTISLTWTLTELGMDSIMAIELKQILEAEFNVFLTPEDLQTMTFAKLQRLKDEKGNDANPGNEITTQLQFIMNEKFQNQIILRLPLIGEEIQEQLSINEHPTVFVIPGFEGLSLNMEPLAKNLPIQTLCFQYHFNKQYTSLEELYNYYSSVSNPTMENIELIFTGIFQLFDEFNTKSDQNECIKFLNENDLFIKNIVHTRALRHKGKPSLTISLLEIFTSALSKYILEELRPEKEFYLIAHSMGNVIALEVAKILENHGRKGRIWLIDGSPTTVQLLAARQMKGIPFEKYDEFIQNLMCIEFIKTLLPDLPKESYSKQIENLSDWNSKKKVFFSILLKITNGGNINDSLLDTYFNVFKAFAQYDKLPTFILQSPCVLIRSVKPLYDLPLDESYGLIQHFNTPVVVHKIDDVDHVSILSHPKTAAIIMKSLPWKQE